MSIWKKGVTAALVFSLTFSFTPVLAEDYDEGYEDYGYDESYDGYGEAGGSEEYDVHEEYDPQESYDEGYGWEHEDFEGETHSAHSEGSEHEYSDEWQDEDDAGYGHEGAGSIPGSVLSPEEKAESDAQWEEDILNLPSSASLDLPEMWQTPELPTGCESVAVTIALNFMGFNLDKETFAREYLRHSVDDMTYGFIGDPFEENGAGIFPPAMVESCNDFLESQGSDVVAFETTTYRFGQLLVLIIYGLFH